MGINRFKECYEKHPDIFKQVMGEAYREAAEDFNYSAHRAIYAAISAEQLLLSWHITPQGDGRNNVWGIIETRNEYDMRLQAAAIALANKLNCNGKLAIVTLQGFPEESHLQELFFNALRESLKPELRAEWLKIEGQFKEVEINHLKMGYGNYIFWSSNYISSYKRLKITELNEDAEQRILSVALTTFTNQIVHLHNIQLDTTNFAAKIDKIAEVKRVVNVLMQKANPHLAIIAGDTNLTALDEYTIRAQFEKAANLSIPQWVAHHPCTMLCRTQNDEPALYDADMVITNYAPRAINLPHPIKEKPIIKTPSHQKEIYTTNFADELKKHPNALQAGKPSQSSFKRLMSFFMGRTPLKPKSKQKNGGLAESSPTFQSNDKTLSTQPPCIRPEQEIALSNPVNKVEMKAQESHNIFIASQEGAGGKVSAGDFIYSNTCIVYTQISHDAAILSWSLMEKGNYNGNYQYNNPFNIVESDADYAFRITKIAERFSTRRNKNLPIRVIALRDVPNDEKLQHILLKGLTKLFDDCFTVSELKQCAYFKKAGSHSKFGNLIVYHPSFFKENQVVVIPMLPDHQQDNVQIIELETYEGEKIRLGNINFKRYQGDNVVENNPKQIIVKLLGNANVPTLLLGEGGVLYESPTQAIKVLRDIPGVYSIASEKNTRFLGSQRLKSKKFASSHLAIYSYDPKLLAIGKTPYHSPYISTQAKKEEVTISHNDNNHHINVNRLGITKPLNTFVSADSTENTPANKQPLVLASPSSLLVANEPPLRKGFLGKIASAWQGVKTWFNTLWEQFKELLGNIDPAPHNMLRKKNRQIPNSDFHYSNHSALKLMLMASTAS
ncbi:MAG: hypothetical protein ACK4M7_02785, partial [Burkholderiales bacterium]